MFYFKSKSIQSIVRNIKTSLVQKIPQSNPPFILVLDEADRCINSSLSKHLNILANLAMDPKNSFYLVLISNLVSPSLFKDFSNNKTHFLSVSFPPPTKNQLIEIIKSRISMNSKVSFHPGAIQLIATKVSSLGNGDIRYANSIVDNCTIIATSRANDLIPNKTNTITVSPKLANQVCQHAFSGTLLDVENSANPYISRISNLPKHPLKILNILLKDSVARSLVPYDQKTPLGQTHRKFKKGFNGYKGMDVTFLYEQFQKAFTLDYSSFLTCLSILGDYSLISKIHVDNETLFIPNVQVFEYSSGIQKNQNIAPTQIHKWTIDSEGEIITGLEKAQLAREKKLIRIQEKMQLSVPDSNSSNSTRKKRPRDDEDDICSTLTATSSSSCDRKAYNNFQDLESKPTPKTNRSVDICGWSDEEDDESDFCHQDASNTTSVPNLEIQLEEGGKTTHTQQDKNCPKTQNPEWLGNILLDFKRNQYRSGVSKGSNDNSSTMRTKTNKLTDDFKARKTKRLTGGIVVESCLGQPRKPLTVREAIWLQSQNKK